MYQSTGKYFTTQALIMALLMGMLATATSAQQRQATDQFNSKASIGNPATMTPPCVDIKIPTSQGTSGNNGTPGNIRTYGQGGVDFKASAFSRNGTWQTAFLGAFGPGLGVTNSTEDGSGDSHKVDNVGTRKDYVLFEFDQDVVIDKLYLDSVDGGDSDVTVWIGNSTDPYNNHLTLSDALLTNFGASETNLGGNAARWVDINAAGRVGNVLVVAAAINQSDDAFTIGLVKLDCPTSNRAKVTIIKEVYPFGGGTSATQIFGYTATGLGVPNFGLVDLNLIGPDRFIVPNITSFGAANPITVTESSMGSWTLLDLDCVETGGLANSTINFGLARATIIVEPGESVVCTFKNTMLAPSAAHASISGRAVTVDGLGISGATLTITDAVSGETRMSRTNPFGYYSFHDLEVGNFYVLTIEHKRYAFSVNTRSFTLVDDLTSVDFTESF